MKRITIVLFAFSIVGCGPRPPHERYRAAVEARLAGDAAAYYRELVALAHDAPDTREGRRARATLTSGDLLTYVVASSMLAAVAIPSFVTSQARAKQGEARAGLERLLAWQLDQKQRTGRWATAIPPDLAGSLAARSYYYFLSPGEPVASPSGDGRLSAAQAAAALERMQLRPRAGARGSVAVAVANLDDDEDLDVWTIDENGAVVHFLDDLK